VEVEGAGDYLPRYAGNLDIMTSAAVRVGEEVGRRLLAADPSAEVASRG
jgi:acetaldehyde dehydrogenase